MAQKSTILKVLIRTSSKVKNSKEGFTLLELIVGLLILTIVGSLAMNAFIDASTSFNKDKKNIDSSQNLSAILEIIGSDIKQSGEQIPDSSFPTIEFKLATLADDPTLKPGSSKVTIRRAVTTSLTLCQNITAGTVATTHTSLVVADNATATVSASDGANCNVGTDTSKLFASRQPEVTYQLTPATPGPAADPVPTGSLVLILPKPLREVRDYRCTLDNPNPTVAYTDAANTATDFCGSPTAALEKIRVAVSDQNGHILVFNQTNETIDTANTVSAKKYGITVNTTGLDATTAANNARNDDGAYPIGRPIYVIEERVYALNSNGELTLSVDGASPEVLVKKVENFNISARGYTNATDRIINPTPPVSAADICASSPSSGTATVDNPQYICKFNYNTAYADPAMNWKMIAGVKVELQSKYDATGRSTTPTAVDLEKLSARAEFFPRNVLSK
jgi:prepilin-type N-terminal cleavage/methylation domain-containing protein